MYSCPKKRMRSCSSPGKDQETERRGEGGFSVSPAANDGSDDDNPGTLPAGTDLRSAGKTTAKGRRRTRPLRRGYRAGPASRLPTTRSRRTRGGERSWRGAKESELDWGGGERGGRRIAREYVGLARHPARQKKKKTGKDSPIDACLDEDMIFLLSICNVMGERTVGVDHGERPDQLAAKDEAEAGVRRVDRPAARGEPEGGEEGELEEVLGDANSMGDVVRPAIVEKKGCIEVWHVQVRQREVAAEQKEEGGQEKTGRQPASEWSAREAASDRSPARPQPPTGDHDLARIPDGCDDKLEEVEGRPAGEICREPRVNAASARAERVGGASKEEREGEGERDGEEAAEGEGDEGHVRGPVGGNGAGDGQGRVVVVVVRRRQGRGQLGDGDAAAGAGSDGSFGLGWHDRSEGHEGPEEGRKIGKGEGREGGRD